MHSSQHHGFWFNYNSDYSGYIEVTDIFNHTTAYTFPEIVKMAMLNNFRNAAFSGAYRDFVAEAAINEGISRLEQMETEDVLATPWLVSILREMVKHDERPDPS